MKPTDTLTLNTGHTMPVIGLGTWKSEPGKVKAAIKYALSEVGYRHIDCAKIYGNEPEIGEAFNEVFLEGKIKRSDVFVTSKLWNNAHNPEVVETTCRQTLADLQLESLDLYLMHWGVAFKSGEKTEPMGKDGKVITDSISIRDTWTAMEKLVEKGLVKSIGVANFTGPMILDLLTYAYIEPAVNQIELHPYNSQSALIEFCQYHQIAVTAYSPLGSPGNAAKDADKIVENPSVKKIADAHHKTSAQVLIKWAISRGTIAIPKSVNPIRIAENFDVFDFKLSESEMMTLNKLNQNHRYVDPSAWWGIPYFS